MVWRRSSTPLRSAPCSCSRRTVARIARSCHDLPKARLTAIPNLFQFAEGERVVGVIDASTATEHEHVVFVSEQGAVKRTLLAEFAEASGRSMGIAAMKLAEGDQVVAVFPGWDDFEVFAVSRDGYGIRFLESEVRPTGRGAGGMRGMKVRADDKVVGVCAVAHEEIVVLATDAGYAKRVRADELPVQARGGAGVRVVKPERKRGVLVGVAPVAERMVFLLDAAAAVVSATEIKLVARDAALPKAPVPDGAVRHSRPARRRRAPRTTPPATERSDFGRCAGGCELRGPLALFGTGRREARGELGPVLG